MPIIRAGGEHETFGEGRRLVDHDCCLKLKNDNLSLVIVEVKVFHRFPPKLTNHLY